MTQRKAQETWVKDRPRFKPFSIGEQVWLEGTNLKLPANLMSKLSPRRYRPFKVVAVISPVAYKLELPRGGPCVVAALPLAGPPPRPCQLGARARSTSIGTGWLFIHRGALVELYCLCCCCCCPPRRWLLFQLFPW